MGCSDQASASSVMPTVMPVNARIWLNAADPVRMTKTITEMVVAAATDFLITCQVSFP
ncbi:MAG: hypothetical protein CM1200mP41_37060 [Gammaproteobacteria bacterium]|nr:MAG: hypothetical protein CM1200mP41_37060 [Gammaproteobacteria bacterium]